MAKVATKSGSGVRPVGFGFRPEESEYHFVVTVPSGNGQDVLIAEHLNFDPQTGYPVPSLGLGPRDAKLRVMLACANEHNDVGWRADAYLYCTETTCPECGWRVPLAPSWVIGEKMHTVAQLIAVPVEKCFSIDTRSEVSREALQAAREASTVKQSRLHCPNPDCGESTPMAAIRGDRRGSDDHGIGLRLWQNDDLVPRPGDVFQERLYCVRWRLPPLEAFLWAEQRTTHSGGAIRQPRRNQDRNDAFLEAQADLRAPADLGARASSPRREEDVGWKPALPGKAPVPDWVDLGRTIGARVEDIS